MAPSAERVEKRPAGAWAGIEEVQQGERRPCRSRVVCKTGQSLCMGARDRYESGVEKGGDLEGRVLGECRLARGRWERAISETCGCYGEGEGGRGTVFRLSETVKVKFLVALHGFVRSDVYCERALQRTATSTNLCLAFAIERFLSRKSWVGVGAPGKGIPIRIESCSGCSRE